MGGINTNRVTETNSVTTRKLNGAFQTGLFNSKRQHRQAPLRKGRRIEPSNRPRRGFEALSKLQHGHGDNKMSSEISLIGKTSTVVWEAAGTWGTEYWREGMCTETTGDLQRDSLKLVAEYHSVCRTTSRGQKRAPGKQQAEKFHSSCKVRESFWSH